MRDAFLHSLAVTGAAGDFDVTHAGDEAAFIRAHEDALEEGALSRDIEFCAIASDGRAHVQFSRRAGRKSQYQAILAHP